MLLFPSHFSNDLYKYLNVAAGNEFFLQNNMGSKDTMVTYWHEKLKKKTHLKYKSIFGERL